MFRVQITPNYFWKNSNDFLLDKESSLRLLGVGLEKWVPTQGIEAKENHVGVISKFYKINPMSQFSFIGQLNDNSPFSVGPKSKPKVIHGLKIPNFSNHPIGLIEQFKTPS